MNTNKTPQVIILGAGPTYRRGKPAALFDIPEHGRVLDWMLKALAPCHPNSIQFIGGYLASQVKERYPEIRYAYNPEWQQTGPAYSLTFADLDENRPAIICYADILFRPGTVEALNRMKSDLVLAIDSKWKNRFTGRSEFDRQHAEKICLRGNKVVEVSPNLAPEKSDAEFVGLLKLSPSGVGVLKKHLLRQPNRETLPALINQLINKKITQTTFDLVGDWAELNAPQDLARFVLGTKAETLDRLKPLVTRSQIGDLIRFSRSTWQEDKSQLIQDIQSRFPEHNVIIRSSALSEDSWLQSSAGAYVSLANIPSYKSLEVEEAIEEVFASYGETEDGDQVLIQEMIEDVDISGVLMTRSPDSGSPYYVINFDDSSKRTDTVTSGNVADLRTVLIQRQESLNQEFHPLLGKVLESVQELEELVGHDSLDIEFAYKEETVHILQVRPIVFHHYQPIDDVRLDFELNKLQERVADLLAPSSSLLGSKNQFSVMTDWNPAEMIGTKPNRLAFSLYRYLITDDVWSRQRAQFGYRDVRPAPLIHNFLGHPFVDIRTDFNSFIPGSLPDPLAEKLVNFYLDKLFKQPDLHDKVEFDVLLTYLPLDPTHIRTHLPQNIFSDEEISTLEKELRFITENAINSTFEYLKQLDTFQEKSQKLLVSSEDPVRKMPRLLELLHEEGLLLFSHLARCAFVATGMLKDLQRRNILNASELDHFYASLETISATLQKDAFSVSKKTMPWNEFIDKYGHLRPGTYDITSKTYANGHEQYLRPMVNQAQEPLHIDSPFRPHHVDQIRHLLGERGFDVSPTTFLEFLRQSICGREYAKFIFTRILSQFLEILADIGHKLGFSREDMAHLDICDLMQCKYELDADQVFQWIQEGKEKMQLTQAVEFPEQVFTIQDLRAFEYAAAKPTFITQVKTAAECIHLNKEVPDDLAGKIVVIANADPGYDWLFTRNIAGLVTMYGGVNSHMAIRASEFRLPAAIGIGEKLFQVLRSIKYLELDCGAQKINFKL